MRYDLLRNGAGVSALIGLALAWGLLIVLLVEVARTAALLFP
jgi:hypothetical protein